MSAEFWANTEDDPDRKRRRQAEFLVHKNVLLRDIDHIAVYGDKMKEYISGIMKCNNISSNVIVHREWYY